jgi:hypothetical protein
VLGNESTGIPPEALETLDVAVEIPMVGAGNSLNVAVAGSLVIYKLAGLSDECCEHMIAAGFSSTPLQAGGARLLLPGTTAFPLSPCAPAYFSVRRLPITDVYRYCMLAQPVSEVAPPLSNTSRLIRSERCRRSGSTSWPQIHDRAVALQPRRRHPPGWPAMRPCHARPGYGPMVVSNSSLGVTRRPPGR